MATRDSPKNQAEKTREASREALLASVRELAGATLQKLWLVQPALVVLQVRKPGASSFIAVDAERAMALVAAERVPSPEIALKAQATLRAALAGARLDSVQLVLALDDQSKQVALRLELTTPSGKRTLLADPRAHALVLAAREDESASEKIIWTAPGAVAAFRPGAVIAPWRPAPESAGGSSPIGRDRGALAASTLETQASERFAAEKQALIRALRAKVQKLSRTLEAVERDSAQAAKAIEARRFAELLLPQQSKIPRGAKVAVVPDWSQLDEEGRPAQIPIALDPALGAAENASRMLKKAHRYAAAGPRIAARKAEIARMHEEAAEQIVRAVEATEVSQLRALSSSSPKRLQSLPAHKDAGARLPYRGFRTSSGARVLVGRSAKDNDTLTLKWARGEDLWLHARGVHGSHVILLDPGAAPDARALGEAAMLAAHFSSARGADGAEVSWTRRKYVRKGKGLAPGAVTFSREKTLRVRLDEAALHALLGREE